MHLHRFKSSTVFLVGFGIGFLLALILFAAQHVYNDISVCENNDKNDLLRWFTGDVQADEHSARFNLWKGDNLTYKGWLRSRGLKSKDIDMDSYLYGIRRRGQLEADWLKSNVHVTCIVFVKKIELARSIKHTWGQRCNKIYFFGQQKDNQVPVITFDRKLVSSWQLLCEAFNYVSKDNKTLEWLIFVKDDTLVIPENLRYMLAPLNYTQDHYLGHAVAMWGQSYNIADAGYVISKGVLRKLVAMFDNSEKCIAGGKYWKQEDYYLAKHLSTMGIHPSDTRDQYLRGTFHGYSLQTLLWGIAKVGTYWTRALYPARNECCSFMSVTFNVGESNKIYTLNYLLYYLYVLRSGAKFGTNTAPVSVPDENVWKIALKEEFNITNLNNISSDAYYNIWHAKYSEPEQLAGRNYRGKDKSH